MNVLALAAAAAVLAAGSSRPAQPRADLWAVSRVPVLHEGRVKPLETVARATLLLVRGKQSISDGRRRLKPIEWLLDVAARPTVADAYRSFRVDDPELLAAIGRGGASGRYFTFEELRPGFDALERLSAEAEAVDSKERTRVQSAALHLFNRLVAYQRLKSTLRPADAEDFSAELAAARQGGPAAGEQMARWAFMAEAAVFRPLPPASGAGPDDWKSVGQALLEAHGGGLDDATPALAALGDAWRRQDFGAFNEALRLQASAVEARAASGVSRRASLEAFFQRSQPFTAGMALYLLAGLAVLASWFAGSRRLEAASFWLLAGAFAVHTAGLAARMLVEGRPPVTNLYSSAVFVGWAGVFAGLWAERRSGGGLAAAASAALGFCTLIVAQHLATGGDTMEMMRAVLDSNFWLATHVVTITAGYGAAFLAGALAHVYLLRGVLTRSLDRATALKLSKMTYFALCLCLFFSFVGTVLGGIWADQSWGRFWGWDPKENGALLIVLWTALLLHARWGGFVRERGIMAMAVFGNVVTALSWFGVNMLGIGLHSYGFMEGAVFWLAAFCLSQLAVMGLAAVPPGRWRSGLLNG
ncbi:MAG: cytochrome c biogenesis protein CcsA [Elusimicrobia bacterium]|nr:cytochrome c biogenesis protein CcsA [Elusimicrobiota bacterium]